MSRDLRDATKFCLQCGVCSASCPSAIVSEFHIRKLVRRIHLDMIDDSFLSSYIWLCSECGMCHELCPEEIDLPKVVLELREHAAKRGFLKGELAELAERIVRQGIPYISLTRTRSSWMMRIPGWKEKIHEIIHLSSPMVYWVGCTPALRAPKIAEYTVRVLEKLGMGFKILADEKCCGEPLIWLGLVEEAKRVADRVSESIKAAGCEQIVTSCASCYNAFNNLYPELLGVKLPARVFHISQVIKDAIEHRGMELKLKNPMKVAYQDPCALGRHSGVYDAPRAVLNSIENLELVEPELSRQYSRCCGGGGGVWASNPGVAIAMALERIAKDFLPLGIKAIVTTCPLCYLNFRMALRRQRAPIKVLDLTEVVYQALSHGS